MTRRLMHYYLDSYAHRPARHASSSTRPSCGSSRSANPDGYDFTLHARPTACGARTCGTTTATARSPPATASTSTATSPTSGATTTRAPRRDPPARPTAAPGPPPSPRPRRSTAFEKRVGFTFVHQLPLRRRTAALRRRLAGRHADAPDDVALRGARRHDANPAVPGYDPHISAELYTTNGEADGHAANVNGIARASPPRCRPARPPSNVDPDDAVEGRGLRIGLHLPRRREADPGRVRQEHPVRALRRRVRRAPGPAEVLGRPRPPPTSPRRRSPRRTRAAPTRGLRRRPQGGPRQGAQVPRQRRPYPGPGAHGAGRAARPTAATDNLYFDAYRARVDGRQAGRQGRGLVHRRRPRTAGRSPARTSPTRSPQRPQADTLVVAEEGAAATQAQTYVDALKANGRKAIVWDVAAQGAPDPLGVLGHFRTVVHYTGAERPGQRHPARSCAPSSTRAAS